MVTVVYIVASIGIAAIAWSIVVLALDARQQLRKVGKATDELSKLLRTVNEEIVPVAKNATSTLSDVDKLVVTITDTAERVDKVTSAAERLVVWGEDALSTTKLVKSSKAGIVSVLEGVKQGIKTLRGS